MNSILKGGVGGMGLRVAYRGICQDQLQSLRSLIQKCLLNIIILMSNPNHIIIPIVRNKPTPEQLNVFQSSALCLTPQKETPFSKVLVDKKYGSAFKRYKQKKERREQTEADREGALPPGATSKPRKPLKLKICSPSDLDFNKNYHFPARPDHPHFFYDPNEAPLFASDSLQPVEPTKTRGPFPEKTERMQEEIQVQLQQKIKTELMEEEIQVKYIEVNFRDDDPFIIVKKTNTKKVKSNRVEANQPKTKPIKKEKGHPNAGETADKKMKVVQEREEKKAIPLFQQRNPLSRSIDLQKQKYSPTCDRPLSGETKVNGSEIPRLKEGREIISLHHMLKEGSVDDSAKSEEDVQIMEEFIIARPGVMS